MPAKSDLREWPYGFLDRFWEYDTNHEFMPAENISKKELIGSIEYVLAVCDLTDREVDILRKRFQDGMTYREIGAVHNITEERVRQLVTRAMRKLRWNGRFKRILSMGVAAYCRQRYDIAVSEKVNEMVAEQVRQIRLEDCKYLAKKNMAVSAPSISTPSISLNAPIEDLDLSVRATNCLIKIGLSTVGDILALKSRDDLVNIRNLGRKSYEEIVWILEDKGFDVEHLKK